MSPISQPAPFRESARASVLVATLFNLAAAELASRQSKYRMAKWKELNPAGSPPDGFALEAEIFDRFSAVYFQLARNLLSA